MHRSPSSETPLQGAGEGLVGRDAELAAIAARLGALDDGPAGVLVLSGETGIGKSALLGVLRERAMAALITGALG